MVKKSRLKFAYNKPLPKSLPKALERDLFPLFDASERGLGGEVDEYQLFNITHCCHIFSAVKYIIICPSYNIRIVLQIGNRWNYCPV